MKTVCTCRMCRRDIRKRIEDVFLAEPRWMGELTILFHGRLGWVPMSFYRAILGRMVLLGIVIKSEPDADEPDGFPLYLLARCMVPAQVLAESVEGGPR